MKLVTKNSESDNNYFLNEIYILRKLDHPNKYIKNIWIFFKWEILVFYNVYISGGELYKKNAICNIVIYIQ
jgi:serine/threonine protein kinase